MRPYEAFCTKKWIQIPATYAQTLEKESDNHEDWRYGYRCDSLATILDKIQQDADGSHTHSACEVECVNNCHPQLPVSSNSAELSLSARQFTFHPNAL